MTSTTETRGDALSASLLMSASILNSYGLPVRRLRLDARGIKTVQETCIVSESDDELITVHRLKGQTVEQHQALAVAVGAVQGMVALLHEDVWRLRDLADTARDHALDDVAAEAEGMLAKRKALLDCILQAAGARPLDVPIYRDGSDDERNDSQTQGAKP